MELPTIDIDLSSEQASSIELLKQNGFVVVRPCENNIVFMARRRYFGNLIAQRKTLQIIEAEIDEVGNVNNKNIHDFLNEML